MSGSSADRLRRLRWLLTVLFTALNAAGLILFAWLLIRDDKQQGEQRLDAELRRVTSTVQRLIQYDETIVTAFVSKDPLNSQCPQFAILPGGALPFQGHLSQQSCVAVDISMLSGVATQVGQTGTPQNGYVRGTNGELVRVFAEPLLDEDKQYIGAVVAASNADPEMDRRERRVLLVAGGCVVLIGAVGVAGHVLSGRAIRPAAAALEQQEVLLAETAHDLRTPVAALRALAETAWRNPAERADLLPRTVNLAAGMGRIIDDLLMRARLAAGVEQLAIQPMWLDQLVARVVEETPAEDARVTLTAAPTNVNADPVLAQRAVANLLNNALRHGRQPGAEAIVHITVAGGRVTVADHGPGIDPALAEQAFDRFSGSGASTGLGLSIVQWVAQAHGGELRVYNAEEGGAIFELVLPFNGS